MRGTSSLNCFVGPLPLGHRQLRIKARLTDWLICKKQIT